MRIVSAADFGVSVENPDNRKALQSAADFAAESGADGIRLPTGSLRVKGPIQVPSSLNVRGN